MLRTLPIFFTVFCLVHHRQGNMNGIVLNERELAIKTQLKTELTEDLTIVIKTEVKAAVEAAVPAAVKTAVEAAVPSAVKTAVEAAVPAAVKTAVEAAVPAAVRDAVNTHLQANGFMYQFVPSFQGESYCCICLDCDDKGLVVKSTCCNQYYHANACLFPIFNRTASCPTCRARMIPYRNMVDIPNSQPPPPQSTIWCCFKDPFWDH